MDLPTAVELGNNRGVDDHRRDPAVGLTEFYWICVGQDYGADRLSAEFCGAVCEFGDEWRTTEEIDIKTDIHTVYRHCLQVGDRGGVIPCRFFRPVAQPDWLIQQGTQEML